MLNLILFLPYQVLQLVRSCTYGGTHMVSSAVLAFGSCLSVLLHGPRIYLRQRGEDSSSQRSRAAVSGGITEKDDVSEKPRRLTIQLADDDDDDDNDYDDCKSNDDGDDDERESNHHPGTTPTTASPGRTFQQLTDEDRRKVDDESLDVVVGPSAVRNGGGGIDGTPALHRPEYRIYKIETPGDEDPRLEIVVALTSEENDATAAAAPASGSIAPPPANHPRPSVRVLHDGQGLVVNPDFPSNGGTVGRLLRLTLPQRVVPASARSFFWEGELTIRAVLAAE